MSSDDIAQAAGKEYNGPYLTGTHYSSVDNRRRITIPKSLVDAIVAFNKGERRIYLRKKGNKVIGLPLPAVSKIYTEFDELKLSDDDAIQRMEEYGSSLHKVSITEKDDRITLSDNLSQEFGLQQDTKIVIKGALQFITISQQETE